MKADVIKWKKITICLPLASTRIRIYNFDFRIRLWTWGTLLPPVIRIRFRFGQSHVENTTLILGSDCKHGTPPTNMRARCFLQARILSIPQKYKMFNVPVNDTGHPTAAGYLALVLVTDRNRIRLILDQDTSLISKSVSNEYPDPFFLDPNPVKPWYLC